MHQLQGFCKKKKKKKTPKTFLSWKWKVEHSLPFPRWPMKGFRAPQPTVTQRQLLWPKAPTDLRRRLSRGLAAPWLGPEELFYVSGSSHTHTPKGNWWCVVTRTRQSDVMVVRGGGGFGGERQMTACPGPSARSSLLTTRPQDTLYQGPSPRWGPGPDHSPVSTITNHSTHLPWVLFVCFPAKSIVSQVKKPGRDSEMHKVV